MDKFVDQLIQFPSSPNLSDTELSKQCGQLCANWLYKVPASSIAAGFGSSGTSLLELLNPRRGTLPFVFVLAAKYDTGGRAALEQNWRFIGDLLDNLDPRQIEHCRKEFRRVVDGYCKHASELDRAVLILKHVKKAIMVMDPSQFSFLHTHFARLCLQAKCYREALPVLDMDVFDFPSAKASKDDGSNGKGLEVGYRDVLEYFLYSGLLYMGLKKWRRAIDCLSHVIAAPGSSCSMVQVEACKKYILVGLLLDGTLLPLPKATSGSVSRALKSLTRPYEAFANAFSSGNPTLFRQEIEYTTETFLLDGNSGLAAQCMETFRRMQITALRNTYITLGVAEIAQKKFDVTGRGGGVGGPTETELTILSMIEQGEISASLSQAGTAHSQTETTVHFDSAPVDEDNNLQALEEQIERVVALNKQVKQMDRKLGLSKEYLTFLSKQPKNGAGGGVVSLDSDMMDLQWGDEDPDESSMHDFDDGL